MKKLLDKNISLNDYGAFGQCNLLRDGSEIKVVFKSGSQYKVALKKLIKIFENPHYTKFKNKLINLDATKRKNILNVRVIKIRRVLKSGILRVYLNNNDVYDVSWDSVLMLCESRYEHFGGFRKTISASHQKEGQLE